MAEQWAPRRVAYEQGRRHERPRQRRRLDEIAIRPRRKSYSLAAGQLRSILLARN
jgi:hypothetical protein